VRKRPEKKTEKTSFASNKTFEREEIGFLGLRWKLI
jgi:hypothetical protein